MIKKLVMMSAVASIMFTACNKPEFQTTPTGLQYKIIDGGGKGRKAQVNDLLEVQWAYATMNDSELYSTFKEQNLPVPIQLPAPPYKGAFEEGMQLMKAGDSAIMITSADSFFTRLGKDMPEFIKKGDKLKMKLKIYSVQTSDEYNAKGMEREKKALADYIKANNISAMPDNEGLYIMKEKEGTGITPAQGDTVYVNYTGKLLDGKVFDSSEGKDPISFPIGTGMVIRGWDKGLMQLSEGTKAKFIIPSALAYGPQGGGPIPPNSTLLFDVELVKVVKAK
ncbi:MAG: FKBP-type peptidyl-prolyl cis-trans isomerase [Bacteroidetes bacterium]|nr:FKBP-type peptidyl-prolyl cis-trans isomerase [Bacteroidota bacterium]